MFVNVCVFQGIRNVREVTIGSSTGQGKTNCHVIIQAEVPSCFGWAPEEDVYVPPVADPSEITARPNVRKKMQNPEVKEIKRGPLLVENPNPVYSDSSPQLAGAFFYFVF
jgi:hypothetical protein